MTLTLARLRFPCDVLATALAVGAAVACPAQSCAQAPAPTAPPGWVARTDPGGMAHGEGAQVVLTQMKPGFHVTTGPAAIVYDTLVKAGGDYRVEATIHLFDPGTRAEGFGIFFGGSDLATMAPHYAYALVRRDGKAMLKVRDGATTRVVRDWTSSAGIPVWKGGPAGTSVRYPLVVEARGDRVSLWVGGTKVLDAARSELPTDGVFGLRINHSLNLHVEKVAVTPLSTRG